MYEKNLTQKILNYLKALPNCFVWKTWGGRYAAAGIPDIICCYKGLFVAFEVKVKGNKPTKLQEATIAKINKAGGQAFVVYSLDEVKNILERIDK